MLRFVADANLPLADEAFGPLGPVRRVPGRQIARAHLLDADVLLVRSVTRVDAALVAGTPVRFVGTATAGTDHLDLDALGALGIATAHAPGSNAASVVDYVLAALLALAADRGEALAGRTLGVVGAGAVGGRLVPRARALGMSVRVCDPPRADAGHADHRYERLADVLAASDVVSLHVSLTDAGPHATRAMLGADALARMRAGAWLVNTARGGVVDGGALLAARHRLGALVLDCWPGEPAPAPALVRAAHLATPHVAGYAADAKRTGTAMLAHAVCAWAAATGQGAVPAWTPPPWPGPTLVAPAGTPETPVEAAAWLDRLMRAAYDVRADSARFRAAMDAAGADARARADAFSTLRRTYPERREAGHVTVRGPVPAALQRAVTDGLGMRSGVEAL